MRLRALWILRKTRFWPESWSTIAAGFIIVTVIVTLSYMARSHGYLVCDMDCGETLLALRASEQFASHGVRFGLLETLGPDDNPLIYTHSVNLGSLTYVLLQALGVQGFGAKLFLPLAAYGLGLLYVYLTVRRVTGSEFGAMVTLLVFATAYWGLGAFAFNALRAWHLVAFFAVAFHSGALVDADHCIRRSQLVGLGFGAFVAFGCGYDFWIVCGSMALCLIVLRMPKRRVLLQALLMLGGLFAAPFLLRQIQVIAALGAGYWYQDFLYTLAIKVPYASRLISLPPMADLDAWYRSQHILRPPASATNSFAQIFFTLRHMLTFVTLPRWGWLGLLTLPAVMALALIPRLRRSLLGLVGVGLIWPMILGIIAGLTILAPFSIHVYVKHEFPLIAFPLLLAKGAIIAWLLKGVFARGHAGLLSAGVALLFVFDYVMVHLNNTATGLYNNFQWVEFARRHPDAEFLLATYQPERSRPIPALDGLKVTYISAQEVKGASASSSSLGTPRYLIYQPSDQVVDFDAPVPRCVWRDWITTMLQPPPPRSHRVSCIYGFPLPPDAVPQPSLDEVAEGGKVVERDGSGIGYVILALE